jgi:rSAM/selenodomain-associated transferase 1
VAGGAKTRLIPLLGPQGAAAVQAALILDTTAKLNKLAHHAMRWLFAAGGKIPEFPGFHHWTVSPQRGRDLSARLNSSFARLLRRHPRAIIIGTDSPLLSPRLLRLALTELKVCDAVIGPSPDGGFYLIGLGRAVPGLLRGVRLSSRHAFLDTLKALLQRGLSCAVLPAVPDIDRPRDLQEMARQMTRRPALRAAAPALWRCLKATEVEWKD